MGRFKTALQAKCRRDKSSEESGILAAMQVSAEKSIMPEEKSRFGRMERVATGLKRLREKTGNKISLQFVHYTFAGCIAFMVDFAFLYVCTDLLGIHYVLSAAIAFVIGMIVNYYFCIKLVFHRRSITNRPLEFTLFVVIGLAGMAVTSFFIWFFTKTFGLHYLYAKFPSALFVYVWKFSVRKLILFR
jgi:putative flippase GtrA